MIQPKTEKPSAKAEQLAYETCTRRDNNRCVRCGSHVNPQRDHRRNRQPGNTVASNLQLLCGPSATGEGCHAWKTGHPTDAVHEGYAVPSSIHDPAEYPAHRLEFGQHLWVLYGSGASFAVIPEAMAMAIRARLGVE